VIEKFSVLVLVSAQVLVLVSISVLVLVLINLLVLAIILVQNLTKSHKYLITNPNYLEKEKEKKIF
jgi:hypothetical protein